MKKLLKFGCGPISYNDNFICSGGNKIGVLDIETNEICATLTGIKNISSLSMDKKYVYAKSTNGVYGMFDLESNSLVYKGSCRDRKDTSHDGTFFCVDEGVVLDIIQLKDNNWYVIKYNFFTNNYEKQYITNNDFYCQNRILDYDKKLLCFWFIEKGTYNNNGNRIKLYYAVNIDDLSVESEMNLNFETGILGLISYHSVLLTNMKIVDIFTNSGLLLDTHNYYLDKSIDLGYFCNFGLTENSHLILAFSKSILFYNTKKCQLIKKIDCKNGFGGAIINNKLYIATWNGLFLAEE